MGMGFGMGLGLLGVGGGPRGFNPLTLSPDVWYDAEDLTTLFQDSAGTTPVSANNHSVGLWQDKSGNARHVIQATSGKRPLYKSTLYNSKPYVKGDGVDDILARAGAFITDASQIWIQAYVNTVSFPGPSNYVFPIFGQGTSQFPYVGLDCYNGFGSTGENRFYAESCSSPFVDGLAYTYPATVAGGQGHLLTAVCSGSSVAITNTGIYLFSFSPAGGNIYYAPEAIKELTVLPAEATGDDFTNMVTYFQGRD